jgi:hypothetical protein
MTVEDFSNGFDVLAQSYTRETSGLMEFDEYEKSVFLTQAQNNLVISLYNNEDCSFEGSEKLRQDLRNLITTARIKDAQSDKFVTNGYQFALPVDLLFIISEYAIFDKAPFCDGDTQVEVVPVRHDEWFKRVKNPFRGPNKRRVLRLDNQFESKTRRNTLICPEGFTPVEYVVKYLKKPSPIILVNLKDENLTVDGVSKQQTCELCEEIHQTILENAVALAMQRYATVSKG